MWRLEGAVEVVPHLGPWTPWGRAGPVSLGWAGRAQCLSGEGAELREHSGNTAWGEAPRPWGWAESIPHPEAIINFQLAGNCRLQTPAP